jgi:hypothetical protein
MNGKYDLHKGETNPSYKDKESGRDKDEALASPSASPPLVVEHLDAPRKEGTVQP